MATRSILSKDDQRRRQEKFAKLLLEGGKSKRQCALEAGYSMATATGAIGKIYNNPYVQELLANGGIKKHRRYSAIASEEEVLETITEIMRNKKTIPRDVLKAAETLGRKYGLWDDNKTSSISVTVLPKVILDVN